MLLAAEFFLVAAAGLAFWAFARRRTPFGVLAAGLRRMVADPSFRGPTIAVFALPVADVIESRFDDAVTAALGYDLTPVVHRLEGDLAAGLQRADWLPVIWASTFAYIVVLPVLMAAPLVLAAAERRLADFRTLAAGLTINYLAALPFYFFVPVQEMWSGNPGKVRLLLDRVSPEIMKAYRANSALDNCFPSLHTSLALTAAILASRGESRRVAAALWIAAIAVVLSTIHLGIHWATDVAGGIVLAAAASRIAVWWVESKKEEKGERFFFRRKKRPFLVSRPLPAAGVRPRSFLSWSGMFGRDLRDAREAERLARGIDAEAAAAGLAEIHARSPGDPRVAGLLARALAELGRFDEAAAAADRAAPRLFPGAARVLRAEVLLDAGRAAEARSALEEARRLEPENTVAGGLLAVIDLREAGAADPRGAIGRLPPGAIWCDPVLSRLVLVLEGALERRAAAGEVPKAFHEARSVLFRPAFDPESFRPFWLERARAAVAGLLGRRARAEREREIAIRGALRAGDLRRAAEIVGAALEDGDSKRGRSDDLRMLALEIAFAEDRFADVLRLHRERAPAGGSGDDAYAAALAAYAAIARREGRRALEVLGPVLGGGDPPAEVLHLAAVAEIGAGREFRAAGLLRRAAARDDMAMEALARKEAEFLGDGDRS